jgi:hypothetical protein
MASRDLSNTGARLFRLGEASELVLGVIPNWFSVSALLAART